VKSDVTGRKLMYQYVVTVISGVTSVVVSVCCCTEQ
jgi:hypothetical protein